METILLDLTNYIANSIKYNDISFTPCIRCI